MIYREDVLAHAYALARANKGAPGVDEQTFEQIESQGEEEWLAGIREELRNKTYQPQAARRVMIPKPGAASGRSAVRRYGTGCQLRGYGDHGQVPGGANGRGLAKVA